MKKCLLTAGGIVLLSFFFSCKKSDSNSSAKTVQNLTGSYGLTALVWTSLGVSVNVYDSLEPCEKDNIIQLNKDLSADFLEGATACVPSEEDHGNWSLSANGDSLYINGDPTLIKSWDGKTLVLTGIVDDGPPQVIGTTTLTKK